MIALKPVLGAVCAASLVAGLAACNRSDPPSQQLEQAAEAVVEAAVEPSDTADLAGPYAPRDECDAVAGAGEFLGTLRGAVAARDADVLISLAADDVKLDFGGGSGHAQLRALLADDDGVYWHELDEALALGCASDGEARLTLPWYLEQVIPVDTFEGFLVTGEDIALRSAASNDAPVLARISWDAVEREPDDRVYPGYKHVSWRGADNAATQAPLLTGYIAEDRLRSMFDFRILAASRNGRWRIVSIVAGD